MGRHGVQLHDSVWWKHKKKPGSRTEVHSTARWDCGWTPGVRYIILGEQMPIFKLNTVCLGKAKCSPKPYIEKEPSELLFLLSLPSKCLYINIKCYLPDETFAGWLPRKTSNFFLCTSHQAFHTVIAAPIVLLCHHLLTSLPSPPD